MAQVTVCLCSQQQGQQDDNHLHLSPDLLAATCSGAGGQWGPVRSLKRTEPCVGGKEDPGALLESRKVVHGGPQTLNPGKPA